VIVIVEKLVEWRLAGETKYSEKTCLSATLSTTNPTCLDPVLNPGRRGGKPATNRLSYGAAFFYFVYEAIGTAAAPGLLCQPRVIVKMIVEKQMECRLARETTVLGENLP
jgi:hypothetical protein